MRRWLLLLPILALLLSGCVMSGPEQTGTGSLCGGTATGSSASLSEEQNANARAIAAAASTLGLSEVDTLKATQIGIVVALTESELKAVNYGDTMNGVMTTSRGLFQQLSAWGSLADRLDPTKSALMFFNGGAAGQQGLLDIPNWQSMTVPAAAQAVEKSQFADGSNYLKNMEQGLAIAAGLSVGAPVCAGGAGAVLANGVNVTIPDNPNVAAAVRGKTIVTPNEGVAKGIAAGFSKLGKPYVWGGSNANGGAEDNGCSRGGGALNSCGSAVGFDCSGLTAYVIVSGGFPGPGTNSSAQRSGGQKIPWDQGLPGEIIGFPGHVALYLGIIDGQRYILEASEVGVPVHVVPLTRSDHDSVMFRYWTQGAVS